MTTFLDSSATSAIPTRTTTAGTPDGNSGALDVVTIAIDDDVVLVVLLVVVLDVVVVEEVDVVVPFGE